MKNEKDRLGKVLPVKLTEEDYTIMVEQASKIKIPVSELTRYVICDYVADIKHWNGEEQK